MISFSWKGLSSACIYLFLFGFSNLLLSDVIWLVVEEEVKGLLTRVQPVGNLVVKLLLGFGDLPGLRHLRSPFPNHYQAAKPDSYLQTHLPGLTDRWMPNQYGQTQTLQDLTNGQGTRKDSKGQTSIHRTGAKWQIPRIEIMVIYTMSRWKIEQP